MWLLLSFFIFLNGCNKSANDVGQEQDVIHESESGDFNSLEQKQYIDILYAAPHNGLNLRTEPDTKSQIKRLLQQYTKLIVLNKSQEKETIDTITDYWYEVDTGEETGWVFGGYLIGNPAWGYNNIIEKPERQGENILKFKNGFEINMNSESYTYKFDSIKVYEKTARNADYTQLSDEKVHLFRLKDNEDWLYLRSLNSDIDGFIFIFDISEKSFYEYRGEIASEEYKIIQGYQYFKRYGPLLIIYYENKEKRFWDGFGGETRSWLEYVVDYYHDYNEVLLQTRFWEGSSYFIYNLQYNAIVDNIIDTPRFNPSRDRFFSIGSFYDEEPELQIYLKDGVGYKLLRKETMDYKYYDMYIKNVEWLNNTKARITFSEYRPRDGEHIIEIDVE
jgi:hypothetical protein